MFEFAGDVSRKDVKNALADVLENEYGLISRAEDNGMALRISIGRDFTPYITLEYTSDRSISAEFIAVPVPDDYDVITSCTFRPVITNAGLAQEDPAAAEKQFYSWYQFATVVKEIAAVTFYPFDYFD